MFVEWSRRKSAREACEICWKMVQVGKYCLAPIDLSAYGQGRSLEPYRKLSINDHD